MRYKGTVGSPREGWENKELRVYDLADEQAYKCVLLDFTLDRSADQPIHRYPFTISLFVYQNLDALTPVLKPIRVAKDPIISLDKADVAIEAMANANREQPDLLNQASLLRARALELRSQYTQWLNQTTQVITSPLDTARNFIDTAFTTVGLAYDTYRAGKYSLERYIGTLELVRDTLNNGLRIYGYQISEGWQFSRTVTIEQDDGISVESDGDVSRSIVNANYSYSGLRVVVVQGQDTLQSIAQRELGDEELWANIAAVNSDIKDNDDLVAGEEIYVPVQVELQEGENKEQFILTEDVARDPYGSDIRLDADGNMVIQENSDLGLLSGVANVQQAIDLRLQTELGSMIKQSVYGLAAQAGFAGTTAALRYVKLAIRSTLIQDPRIESISNMVVSIGGDTLQISMDIGLVGSDQTLPVTATA
jgi:hypothetical protein